MDPIEPNSQVKSREFLLWWLAPILALLLGLSVWYNHFQSSFHADDTHTIVENSAIRNLGNIGRFFTTPRTSADSPEYAAYRPFLTTTFALDYWAMKQAVAQIFQIDSFAWFLLQILVTALLFSLIPGLTRLGAITAAALFAVHPLTTGTVNYASQRGSLIAAGGIAASLVIWIYWPRMLPARIIYFDGVPTSWWKDFRKRWDPPVNAWYQKIIHLPLHLYLIPVLIGLLAEPRTAAFAFIFLAYLLLFEPARVRAGILPAAILCGGYWVTETALGWNFSAGARQPFASYLFSQPLVISRAFLRFFAPVHLSVVSDLSPAPHFWSPTALCGYLGLACIIWLAVQTAKRSEWRVVSFGLWWFLAGLAPDFLIPDRVVEAPDRPYIAWVGLALASVQAAWILAQKLLAQRQNKLLLPIAGGAFATVVLVGCGYLTHDRNEVWSSETGLWEEAVRNSPQSAVAFVRYARALLAEGLTPDAAQSLDRAAALMGSDPSAELELARALDDVNRDSEAEVYFRRAIHSGPRYAPAYAWYAQWLLMRQRIPEALAVANKGVQTDPSRTDSRHVLIDLYLQESEWKDAQRVSEEAIAIDPNDPPARRALNLTHTVLERLEAAEHKAANSSDVNEILNLSVLYYENKRFEDSIEACRKAIAIQPNLVEAYSNLAAAQYALGKFADSAETLTQALKIRPDFALARRNLDFLQQVKGTR